ncbi:hypothetical protein CJ030_MR4G021345 [Morella rubra]|uniref:Uncharacterized protein n=1 Tax=Morella rubra TaxID=262757 RepID=A0A6A1VK75_9ROSI|nr:hypothetical protein CJ030_MR6G021350 [Morella rubra]KAB1216976.1 hypothetical protein CJ030_MR4G021345 [Morella rubra]
MALKAIAGITAATATATKATTTMAVTTECYLQNIEAPRTARNATGEAATMILKSPEVSSIYQTPCPESRKWKTANSVNEFKIQRLADILEAQHETPARTDSPSIKETQSLIQEISREIYGRKHQNPSLPKPSSADFSVYNNS